MKRIVLLLLIISCIKAFAQNYQEGEVIDQQSKEALAFVNVLFNNGQIGVSSDIDGKFKVPANGKVKSLLFSCIGYERKQISFEEFIANPKIELKAIAVGLGEVEILPGENPAHRIINLAIENRKINNPEKATPFHYESYNKLVFTAELDSLDFSEKDSLTARDSSDLKAQEFLSKQHLFMMESVTERNHIPPSFSKEVVLASRISGLQNPIFTLIGTQLQSFSLYNTYIDLFGEKYLSPISKGSTSKYLFILEDTLYSGKDTVFTMSFQPRKGTNFIGLKGSISINTNSYAVENFIATQADQVDLPVKIQQKYQFINNKQWFPVQLNTRIEFGNITVNGRHKVLGIGRSYLKNIELESKLEKSKIGNTVLEMDNKAGKKEPSFWDQYRNEQLSSKEEQTYQFMDSLGEAENLDRKVKLYSTLFQGAIPLGPFNLPLNQLLAYNGYEGFRLGLGAETNDKVLKWLKMGGYGAYGFKDKAWKYGYHARWTPQNNRQFELKASYHNDVVEFGGTKYPVRDFNAFSSESLQSLFMTRMDQEERIQGELSFRALRDFHFTFFGATATRTITSDYEFLKVEGDKSELISSSYQISEVGAHFRYSFREKYAEMFGVKVPVSTKYPVVNARITKGLDGTLEGEFDYLRLDLKVDQSFVLRNLGVTSLRLAAGAVDQELPMGMLFRTPGTFNEDYRIASSYSFETVGANEFYTDRYVHFFFRHNFGQLIYQTEKFKPELSLVTNIGFGDLGGANQHQNILFLSPNKGLYESGLQIDNVLRAFGIGVGAFYRYGEYSHPDWEENIAVKLTTVFNF